MLQTIRKVLVESIDSTPHIVSSLFKTGVGDYAEHDRFLGVRVPAIRKIAKEFMHISFENLIFLMRSAMNEERLLALVILTEKYKTAPVQQRDAIYQFYKDNIFYVNNWNLVDMSAHTIIGAHLFDKDRYLLEKFAESDSLWERRISIVATWYFIRRGDLEWTFKIAALLLSDKQDLVHKAVGWMLREAGKQNQGQLELFLARNSRLMPRTMLRYATEKLSENRKKYYLTKSVI
ncbi:DNA alkylation repair protein [Candidatus Hydrogenosomobacter endosymbioticus]|nr:DNA alkylation repair protein [Candidatus Hydrogenosomobacter endosymbioticus]